MDFFRSFDKIHDYCQISTWLMIFIRLLQRGISPFHLRRLANMSEYIRDPVWYSQARALCQAEGSDLIRIDSDIKYNTLGEIINHKKIEFR